MAAMGRYCKAYPVVRFREYSAWKENTQNLRKEKPQGGLSKEASPGKVPRKMSQENAAPVEPPRVLTDDDYLYLQENLTVTDGIFIDENVVFDDVTPEWMDFCKNTLEFEVPSNETVQEHSSL